MKALRRRYGHAKKLSESEQRARLHELLQWRSDTLDGRAGPMNKHVAHEFGKLAYKFKYDPEFQDFTHVRYAGKPGPAPKYEDMPVMSNKVRISGMS